MRRILLVPVGLLALAVGLIGAGELGWGPVVITREGEQKLILTLGNPRTVTAPGWALRIPLIENVRIYESRLLYYSTEPREIQTKDEERIVVDNYVVWWIADPQRFLASFPQGMQQAKLRIDAVVKADVRAVIGQHTWNEVLTGKRVEIMSAVTEAAGASLVKYGIGVRDVRINRSELPKTTEENVYARMQTERERLARKHRAEGEERARRIRAEADREARVIVAEARKEAEISRGIGDAQAARIYAEAYSTAPKFYGFVRSLEAYRKTIGDHTTLVISPNSEFFQFFEAASPNADSEGPASRADEAGRDR